MLCYGLARRILGYTRHTDDRPFTQEKKQVLPIRGFKGNRVIYGDISDDEDEDILTKDEPLYSEPVFTLSSYKDSGLSSLDSGYTVSDSQGYYSDDQTEFFSSTPVLERDYLSGPPPYRHPPPATIVNNTVIDTLLQKYDSLQRRSESWGLCSEKSLYYTHRWEEQDMLELGNCLSEGVGECVGENDTQQEACQSLLSDVKMLSAKLTCLEGKEFDESPYRFMNRKWRSYDCYDIKEKEASKNDERKEGVDQYFPDDLDNLEYIENEEIVRQTSLYFGLNLEVPPPLPPRRVYAVEGWRGMIYRKNRSNSME